MTQTELTTAGCEKIILFLLVVIVVLFHQCKILKNNQTKLSNIIDNMTLTPIV